MDAGEPGRGAMQCHRAAGSRTFFGGDLLKTRLPEGDHFYNRIGGRRYDFTESQFSLPITYADLPTTRAEAERGATIAELAALRLAFQRHSITSG